MTVGLICLAAVLLLAFLRVPLGFALLTVSIAGIWAVNSLGAALTLIPLTLTEAVFSYDLAVVPLFILMGDVLSRTGIAHDLFRAANAFLGPVRGGLALATMVTCGGFSAVCGSSFATAATMSKVAYPSMKKYGYSDRLASATIAATIITTNFTSTTPPVTDPTPPPPPTPPTSSAASVRRKRSAGSSTPAPGPTVAT